METRVVAACTQEDYEAVRTLCWQYRDFLMSLEPEDVAINQAFYPIEKYRTMLARLEEVHGSSNGRAVLALTNGHPTGCGMWHRVFGDAAEIKRLFVTEEARGTGAAREMMNVMIAQCRDAGLSRILLDTSVPLTAAQRLYESMGFQRRDAYQDIPAIAVPRTVFYELQL